MLSLLLLPLFNLLWQTTLVKAVEGDAWHLDTAYILVNEELDPIISPNAQSSHMHKVIGGSAFAAGFNFPDYRAGTCSSIQNQADMSNYWMPNLYWVDTTLTPTKFIPLPVSARFYLFLSQNSANDPMRPFPDGLRIVTGDPNSKSPPAFAQFVCQAGADGMVRSQGTNFNFNTDCPAGMKVNLFFPQCWDGLNLYLPGSAHMTWPAGGPASTIKTGGCPWSHPIKLPTLMLEYTFHPESYNPGVALAGNLAWANGDTTGFGIHGDFINAWDRSVFSAALNDTSCVGQAYSIPMESCNSMAAHYDTAKAAKCVPDKGILKESFGNADLVAIPRLPGCNPLWGANGTKPKCSDAIPALDVTALKRTDGSYIAAASQQANIVLPTTSGWTFIACITGNSFTNGVSFVDNKLSQTTCQEACLKTGFSYAAVGGHQDTCMCATGIEPTAPMATGMCTLPCPGNSTQTCGNSYVFSVFYAGPGTVNADEHDVDIGCYSNPSTITNGLLGKAFYKFLSSTMTVESCSQACINRNATWALTTAAVNCYCGQGTLMDNIGTGTFVPDTQCTTKCPGNSSEICGDSYRSSVYNLTNSGYEQKTAQKPAGWQGCYAEGSSQLALQGTWWPNTTMTVAACVNGCSELNYTYAGVEAGTRCYCGNTFYGGQNLPSSQCSYTCGGNANTTCGGYAALELYSTATGADYSAAQFAAMKPAGWQGCYQDNNGATILTSYSYTVSNMNVATCKTACTQFGYTYAGVENGNQCKCGNTAPTSIRYPSGYCSRACGGDASQTCGSTSTAEVYLITKNATTPVIPVSTTGTHIGCYSDSTRGLPAYPWSSPKMTVEMCTSGCHELNYQLGGVEYGTQCFCDNVWRGGQQLPQSSCSMACGGNASQTCGNGGTIDVYNVSNVPAPSKPTGWQGCYSNKPFQDFWYYSTPMESNLCKNACGNLGYTMAATYAGQQCYCGNAINATTSVRVPATVCSTACPGVTSGETCGASYYSDVYLTANSTIPSNGVTGYAGCYNDADGVVTAYQYTSTALTPFQCATSCLAKGYAVSATELGNKCKCGATMPSKLVSDTLCSTPCSGNSSLFCGYSGGGSVVKTANAGVSAIISVSANATGYYGCFAEGSTKIAPYLAYTSSSNTPYVCAASCKALGYALSGVELGTACYCTQQLNATTGGYLVADSECSTACPGGLGLCGGTNRISIWSSLATKGGTIGDGSNTNTTNTTSPSTTPEGWVGCYAAGTFVTSAPYSYTNSFTSASLCRRTCRLKGYSLAGLMNGNACMCGTKSTLGVAQPEVICNTRCAGNSTELCGSSSTIAAYDTTGTGSLPPPGFPQYYAGCYQDQNPKNFNLYYTYSATAMNSLYCQKLCAQRNSTIYGTEGGNQCWCAAPGEYPIIMLPDSYCDGVCPVGNTEMCGGYSKMSTYDVNLSARLAGSPVVTSSSSSSISTSTASSQATTSSVKVTASATSSTPSALSVSSTKALSASVTASVSKASGTASLTASSSKALSSTKASSASVTAGSTSSSTSPKVSSTINAGSLIVIGSSSATASSTSTKVSAVSSASQSSTKLASSTAASSVVTSTASSSAAPQPSSTDTTYLGCFGDSNKVINSMTMSCSTLTPTMCKLWCRFNGFKLAGVSNGDTCNCGSTTTTSTSSLQIATKSLCSTACSGNATEICGGSSGYMSVYDATEITLPSRKRAVVAEFEKTKRTDKEGSFRKIRKLGW